jgi:hypothetical protein
MGVALRPPLPCCATYCELLGRIITRTAMAPRHLINSLKTLPNFGAFHIAADIEIDSF